MYKALLIVQYITIFGLLLESWIVFHRWKNEEHSYLFIMCIAALITNAGYLKEMLSHNEESYMIAQQLSYMAKVWIPFALFLYSIKLIKLNVPMWIRVVLSFFHMATSLVVLSSKWHQLFFTHQSYTEEGLFPHMVYGNGIWHHLYMGVNVFYALFCIINMYIAARKEKDFSSKRKIMLFGFIWIAQCVSYLIFFFKISKVYDTTVIGYAIMMGMVYIAVFKYNVLDTAGLAREYLIDEIAEGIIAVDNDGIVDYFNRPAEQILPELTKRPKKAIKKVKEVIEEGGYIEKDNHLYAPKVSVLYENEKKAGELYLLPDMTNTIKNTKELKEQRELAEQANKAKSIFLANMSHEIRTPINSILGMDEMILRESDEEQIKTYAEYIMSSGRTLLTIVNDILDFTKVEEGKMEINPTQYEFASLANDLVNIAKIRAEKKGLEFNIDINGNIPVILYGDSIRIKQCALNILSNAVKYTKKGHVDLIMDFEELTDSTIGLIIRVKDTGIGMKEEDIERLFSPFARLEQKRNRTIEGTGLGMTITKQLLELMGSRINVKSVYGEGSEFWFVIEQEVINSEPIGDYAKRYRNEVGKGSKYREIFHAPDASVLVVDDTETNLAVIKNLLKKTQMKIDLASSGKDALALVEKNKYNVAFIDHMMPEMDGIETLEKMKEMPNARDTVFIVLTANAVSGAREQYLDAGFHDYISKPVDGIKLERVVKSYLPKEMVTNISDDSPSAEEAKTEEETSVNPETDKILVKLRRIPNLSVEDGIINCGGEEAFLNVINVFHQTAIQKALDIENSFNSNDIGDYTIRVHALKSASRIIGASVLSNLAKDLEKAGKEGNTDLIQKKTPTLLSMFRELDFKLNVLNKNESELVDISAKRLKEAYRTIYEISEMMDYGMLEKILKDLKIYRLPDDDKRIIDNVTDYLMTLDWDSIKEEVSDKI